MTEAGLLAYGAATPGVQTLRIRIPTAQSATARISPLSLAQAFPSQHRQWPERYIPHLQRRDREGIPPSSLHLGLLCGRKRLKSRQALSVLSSAFWPRASASGGAEPWTVLCRGREDRGGSVSEGRVGVTRTSVRTGPCATPFWTLCEWRMEWGYGVDRLG